MAAFGGFPPGALEFLRELEANNERDWFKANRARYDELLLGPAAGLALNRPELVRAPRGYPLDHPRIDLLRRRTLTVSCRHPLARWIHGSDAGRRIHAELDAATPLVRWLRERVGPSERPRPRR